MLFRKLFCCVFLVALIAVPIHAQRVLFDARHGQTAGAADWIVDAETAELVFLDFQCRQSNLRHQSGQRFPVPPQETITLQTPETVWSGGISAWAVDLVKDALDPERGRDWRIEQYAWNAPEMSFGNPANPQDLSNYDVLILCEPNHLFTDAEAEAIREFVWNGGGLFMIADHETSDRDCSGGPGTRHDSPLILNRLMQTAVDTRRTPPYYDPVDPDNDYGVFGIWFYENDNDDQEDQANKDFDWFTEATNRNVANDPDDPILHGPFGNGSGGLGLFASTQIAVSTHPEKGNPTARAHIWRNGQNQQANPLGVWQRVTLATASYGAGRVVAIPDSSPADDSTGQGDLHDGWNKASGGVANDVLFLNATEWLADPKPDTEPPRITAGPSAAPEDCRATIRWVTDEPAGSTVEWGLTAAFGQSAQSESFATGHEVVLEGLSPQREHFFRVISQDPAGNRAAPSATASFSTTAPTPLVLLGEPAVTVLSHETASVSWATNKPTAGSVRLHRSEEAERVVRAGARQSQHEAMLTGLEPASEYRFRVEATDACGSSVASIEGSFTTAARPASRDLSGWRLLNSNTNFQFVLPPGTKISAGGFLVIGRAADQATFETEWGTLAAGASYVGSGDKILINSTARAYRLLDGAGNVADGPTLKVRAGQSLQRQNGCAGAGEAAAWQDLPSGAGGPGRGTLAPCGAGVVISELSDARDFRNEFVELYFDP